MIVDAGVTSWNKNPSEVGLHLNTGMWGQGSHTIDKEGIKRAEMERVLEASRLPPLLCK